VLLSAAAAASSKLLNWIAAALNSFAAHIESSKLKSKVTK
jgi:hypothetical protein